MATFTVGSPNSSFVRNFTNRTQQLQGKEGQQLNEKIVKVSHEIKAVESVQRLLESLEQDNQRRHQRLLDYIQSLRSEVVASTETEFTLSVLEKAEQTWENLRSVFLLKGQCLEVPDACPGCQDNLMYAWSKGEHYLECEIFGTGEVEFFYRNNNETWGEDIKVGQEFSTAIIDKVALFAW
ncbi:MAG: hypothetical protein KME50_21095 [Nostoc desertorum CM1-VF14]|jgi:hypothetical protein|nr:hypothetical protein [Nostoc desertorum CM1-VF14]